MRFTPNYLEVNNVILNTNQTTDHSTVNLAGDAQEKVKSDHIQEYVINNQ
jgi:hypothetical protein